MNSQLVAEFQGKKGNYIKSFLINDSINANLWQSKNEDLKKWVGKPGVLYEKDGTRIHPESDTKQESLKEQEKYRVSTIIDAGVDSRTGNKYVIEEVHDDKTFEKIKSGQIKFRSPSVWPDEAKMKGMIHEVTSSTPLHHAFVDVPAYGEQAKISGTCTDTEKECKDALGQLVANTVDSRSEYVRVIPFTSFNVQPNKEESIMEEITSKKKEELKALRAELDETKKELAEIKSQAKDLKESKSGNEDDDSHKKSSDASSDDSENKEETKKANQLEEELEREKARTASLTKFVTESMVNEMIAAAQSNGTPEKQLVAMRKEFESADIDTLVKTKALAASFAPNIASNITTDIPDPAHALSASTEEMSDDELIRRLYS